MARLDKDVMEKQAHLKNTEKNIKDNEMVQKKLSRYIDDLTRNFDKNKKRREEVMLLVRKYKREYDLKREQLKQLVQNLRDINEGKDIAIEEGIALKVVQLNEAKKNLEISIQELKQVRTLISRLDRERREAAESLNTLQESNDGIRTQILKVQSELKVATDFLASKPFNPKAEGEKATEKKKLEEQMREVSRKLDGLELGGD